MSAPLPVMRERTSLASARAAAPGNARRTLPAILLRMAPVVRRIALRAADIDRLGLRVEEVPELALDERLDQHGTASISQTSRAGRPSAPSGRDSGARR